MTDKRNYKVIIVGAGGIGRAVGLLLAELADFGVSLFLGDRDLGTAMEAAHWINTGNTRSVHAESFQFLPGYENKPENVFTGADIVLDCLPGSEAPRIGSIAKTFGLHYVNLTEYVNETEQLKKIAADASTGFILQTGLAPGFVNILSNSLYKEFAGRYKNEQVEYLGMKVGALTEHAEAPHFYGFTWSPVGVATEYLKDAWIISNYQKTSVAALSGLDNIIIKGVPYEENYTSGGAADLPDAFSGLARRLDYKTLRYPGHYNWVKNILASVPPGTDKVTFLEKQMLSVVPVMDKDLVVIYAVVKGFDLSLNLRSIESAFRIKPVKIGNVTLKAIQSTTAAPMAECARMLLTGQHKGVILQSNIDPAAFLTGPFIRHVYFPEEKLRSNITDAEVTAAA